MLVFDEFLNGPMVYYYTKDDWDEALGAYDQLAIHAVVDNIDASGTLTVQVQNSADRKHYINKNSSPEISQAISIGQITTFAGYENGTKPSLRYVRLAISLVTTARAHVKLLVTTRDQGVGDETREAAPGRDDGHQAHKAKGPHGAQDHR